MLWGFEMKAIKTTYNGIEYRSRTEARWAKFLELIDAGAQYEPEGFDLDGEWYIPDFFLSRTKCWLEVKPFAADAREDRLGRKLSKASGMPVVIVEGNPGKTAEFKFSVDGAPFVRAFCVNEFGGKAAYLCTDTGAPHEHSGVWLSPHRVAANCYGLPHPALETAGALRFERDGSTVFSQGNWRERERQILNRKGYQFGRKVVR